MQQSINPVIHTINTAVVVSAPKETASRFAYIDLIRVILIILVVMVHAAITYGSTGD